MFEISATIPPELADELEAVFCEYTGCSPWMIRKDREDSPTLLYGYFEEEAAARNAWAELRNQFSALAKDYTLNQLEDTEWQNAYKAYLKPWQTGHLHWVPEWMREEYQVPDDETCVWFDAGMAFGTGNHETTRLCAMKLLEYIKREQTPQMDRIQVIDAGCGSGILAISAYKLGVCNIHAFDHDPEAIRVSKENLERNQLAEDAIRFETAGLEEGLVEQHADLLLANIQADVLRIHASSLLKALNVGGWLVLSGVLKEEKQKVANHFRSTAWKDGLPKLSIHTKNWNDWAVLVIKHANEA